MNRNKIVLIFIFVFFSCVGTSLAQEKLYFSKFTNYFWQIWVMNQDGYNAQSLTQDSGDKRSPQYLASSNTLLYEDNKGALYKQMIQSNSKTRLFKHLPYINGFDAREATGDIALAVYRTDIKDFSNIWVGNLASNKDPIRLTNGLGIVRSPKWHPTENKILFTLFKPDEKEAVYLLNVDTKETTKVLEDSFNNIYASFLSDGQSIVFSSDRQGNYDICVMDLETKKVNVLTDYKGLDTFPKVSNDGKYIFYVSNQSGNLQIWKMNISGEGKQQLTQSDQLSKF